MFKLGYAEFTSERVEPAARYYTEIIGSCLVEQGPDGTHHFSLGLDHHNIALRPSTTSANSLNGFQVSKGVELDEFALDLASNGLNPSAGAARPGVPALLGVRDFAGFDSEFYAQMTTPAQGVAPFVQQLGLRFYLAGITPSCLCVPSRGHAAMCGGKARAVQGGSS